MGTNRSREARSGAATWRIGFIRLAEISAVAITLLIILALLLPIRNLLEDRDIHRFEAEAALVQSEVEDFFEIHHQLASQIPSRTRIREELVRLLDGETTLADYRAFTDPKLGDAVAATKDIIAAIRYDRSGRRVGFANPLGLPAPDHLPSDNTPGLDSAPRPGGVVHDGNESIRYYFYIVSIFDPAAGLVGWDLVALSLESLHTRLVETVSNAPVGHIAVRHRDVQEAILSVSDGSVAMRGGKRPPVISREHALSEGWMLQVAEARAVIFADTRREISVFIGVTAVLGVLLFLVSRWAAVLLEGRNAAERAELESIVSERTARLSELLRERDVLLREVHHRIKNDMSMVQSVLSLQRHEASTDAEQRAFADAESRVGLMSEIYDLLYRSDDFETVRIQPVLANLLQSVVKSHSLGEPEVDVTIDVDDIVLPRSVAAHLGMIANELVINAIKYGCDPRAPRIAVAFRGTESAATEKYVLEVSDNGPGFPEDVKAGRTGFGLEMVNAFIQEHDGSITFPDASSRGDEVFPGTIRVLMAIPEPPINETGR
ncbi:MAG: ATP-binding protein [Spirochaeta sp.]|jgi:two-component sensor histidine kinase|nr:ATP-binding protein [Spirochaeta sp.]